MNTNTITMNELAKSKNCHGYHSSTLVQAARTLHIANRAIEILSDGQRRKAGEIAKAIGLDEDNYEFSPAQVGTVMRKLVSLGRIKREEVEGEPIEITIPACYYTYYDYKKHDYVSPHPAYTKTITPKANYYSLA